MYRILYRFLASLARLTVRSGRSKDLEIVVLRHHSRCCAGTDAAMCVGVEVHSFDIAQILYNGFIG